MPPQSSPEKEEKQKSIQMQTASPLISQQIVRRSSQIGSKNEQQRPTPTPKMLNSLNIMMQRAANVNASGFGNQCAYQNLKCSDNHQNMMVIRYAISAAF